MSIWIRRGKRLYHPRIGFGAAGGEKDFGRIGADGVGNVLSGGLEGRVRKGAGRVQAGRIAIVLAQKRHHFLQGVF